MELMQDKIQALTSTVEGRMGVAVMDMRTGEMVGVNPDEQLPMASVCKIPILVTAYREHDKGRLNMDERVEFTNEMRCLGSGLFNAFHTGIRPTIHDLLLMMITVSDNAATDIVLDKLTPALVSKTMCELGFNNIHVDRTIHDLLNDILTACDPRMKNLPVGGWDELKLRYPDLEAISGDLDIGREAINIAAIDKDTSTARDIAQLCAGIAKHKVASKESCKKMLALMDAQQLNGRLPRELPAFTRFPHKTGTLGSGAVCNDAGILFADDEPVAAVAVLSRDVRNPICETNSVIASIGRTVYDFYMPSNLVPVS